jgi:rhamnosyltransferase
MATVSIIIRTKNEERWIGHCLSQIFEQSYKDFEVIVVDNCSDDYTVQVAQRFPIKKVLSIGNFLPGKAINQGVRVSSGDYIVCLSAHCIPRTNDWLINLLANFSVDPNIAGVYGRQLPLSFTDPIDKRDLLIVFGQDKRVQVRDYFFHNANSMIRRDIWEKIPFNELVTNIEDRVWGKEVTDAGFTIVYEPAAEVYHYHGLHQGNSIERANGVVSIIEKVDQDVFNQLPKSLTPEQVNIVAVVPVADHAFANDTERDLLVRILDTLSKSRFVKRTYLVATEPDRSNKCLWINRQDIANVDALGMDELLKEVLIIIEGRGDFPDGILYANHQYTSRPEFLFDELIHEKQYRGYDSVFAAYADYGHFWYRDEEQKYKQTDNSMKNKFKREPVFRALYGLGTVVSSHLVRTGNMIGGKIGIHKINDPKYQFRLDELKMGDLI